MKVHIIGGGVVGLCSAWYLRKTGFEVAVVDQADWSDGCSYGNAGMVVPSHIVPLAAPGVIAKGLRWMFDAGSPFYIRPRLDWALARWLWQFYRSCSEEKVRQAMPLLRDFNQWSKDLYREFAEEEGFAFSYEEKGILMLYKTPKAGREEEEAAEKAHALGMRAQKLDASGVRQIETSIRTDVLGAVYYPGDAHLYSNQFMQQLLAALRKMNVSFMPGHKISGFKTQKGKISHLIFTNQAAEAVGEVVLAAGSWSAKILKKLGIKMLMQDGKGYSVTMPSPALRPGIPSILLEAKVALTPMGQDLRAGGTLEISGHKSDVSMPRVEGILKALPQYYPELKVETPPREKIWYGFRPCTPDGLPYIGRSKAFSNLTIATGHAMMGMSMGPASGKLVAEILANRPTSLDIGLLAPERF